MTAVILDASVVNSSTSAITANPVYPIQTPIGVAEVAAGVISAPVNIAEVATTALAVPTVIVRE